MNAFPTPHPNISFRQFAELVQSGRYAVVTRIEDPSGDGNEALYRFTRTEDKRLLADVVEYVENDTDTLTPTVFRTLCKRLSLPDVIGGMAH